MSDSTPEEAQLLKQAMSKQPIANFMWSDSTATVFPDFRLDKIIDLINEDPVARAALQHYVDKCMEGDYAVVKRDTKDYDDAFELVLDEKFKFRTEVLRKIFLMGKLFNNVFVEVVQVNNETKAVNVVDSTLIEPVTKINGDVIKFITRPSSSGTISSWTPSEMFWIKFNDRSVGFAPVDLQTLWKVLYTKMYIIRFVAWLFETGQYRLVHNLKASSKKDIQDFLAYNNNADRDFRKPFLAKGEYESKVLRDMSELQELQGILKYLDSQILINMRVPPIDVGIPDASGRSNADAQSNNLNTHITSNKKVVEDAINFDLFPRMNHGNNLLRFAPNDRFSVEQAFTIAQTMKSMGMTDEAVSEYLYDMGLVFKTKELFVKEPVQTDNPRNLDNMPSRKGKTAGTANQKIGTGQQASTRPDQL